MTIPTLRWPSQAALIPARCPRADCRSRLLNLDPPHGLRKTGDVVCVLCSWIVVDLVADCVTPKPAETDWVQDEPPQRGRPPKKIHYGAAQRAANAAYRERLKAGLVQRERWATDWDACVKCGTTNRSHHGKGLCYGCRNREPERERARQRRAGVAS